MFAKFKSELSKQLEINIDDLNDSYVLNHEAGWDSIDLMTTIMLIDQFFGVFLESYTFKKVKTWGELKVLIHDAIKFGSDDDLLFEESNSYEHSLREFGITAVS